MKYKCTNCNSINQAEKINKRTLRKYHTIERIQKADNEYTFICPSCDKELDYDCFIKIKSNNIKKI